MMAPWLAYPTSSGTKTSFLLWCTLWLTISCFHVQSFSANTPPPAKSTPSTSTATSTASSSEDHYQNAVYTRAAMDYESANTYMAKYYKGYDYHSSSSSSSTTIDLPYFINPPKVNDIYNARLGIIGGRGGNQKEQAVAAPPTTLNDYGFCLLKSPYGNNNNNNNNNNLASIVKDWEDPEDLAINFCPLGRHLLEMASGGGGADTDGNDNDSTSKISDVIFWTPNYRPSSQCYYISKVHLDTDFNSYCPDVEELLEFVMDVRLNSNGEVYGPDYDDEEYRTRQIWTRGLQAGQRFALINLWCNVDTEPVQTNPLAIFRPHYDCDESSSSSSRSSTTTFWPGVPQARPNLTTSKWYTFPDMAPDEVLVFRQYDRDIRNPSDTWHAALPDDNNDGNKHKNTRTRKSFDVRCLVLFDEIVPVEYDRWHNQNRLVTTRPPEEYWIG